MVAGCGMTCIKYIVFAVNFLFFVMGIAAVALGIYALVDKNDMKALTTIDKDGKLDDFNGVGLLQSGAIVLIVGGSFLLIMGFLGCCGAVKEVKCLLATYAAIVILIIIVQVTAAGLAIAFRGRISDKLKDGLKKGIIENYDGNLTSGNTFSRAWDFAQVNFECCGVTNATVDFVNSKWYNTTRTTSQKVPKTCCALNNKDKVLDDNEEPDLVDNGCPSKAVGDSNLNTNKPCYSSVEDWIKNRAAIIIGIALGIVFIEVSQLTLVIATHASLSYREIWRQLTLAIPTHA
ncbi:tetraspanin-18-like isoform X1 [Littorina saxatilis]|uniref:tetraspanin-18-like isoform X1 n=1 Tax=Littorina saxatilis TaxID=31220 RepID=UPI0038B491EC